MTILRLIAAGVLGAWVGIVTYEAVRPSMSHRGAVGFAVAALLSMHVLWIRT